MFENLSGRGTLPYGAHTMPTITADAALAVVPFFAPLTIVFCVLLFALARSQTDTVRRVDLLEQKLVAWRPGATAPLMRLHSPLAAVTASKRAIGASKESGQP
jgi:hypothetical protein